MGAEHGAYCVGCCFGLMLILFALGVMSLVWMGVVAVAMLVQKTFPLGRKSLLTFAGCLVAVGIWVAAAPASVPGLVQPNQAPAMQMDESTPADSSPMMIHGGGSMSDDGMGGYMVPAPLSGQDAGMPSDP
jgi:hypothetical protein